MSNQWTLLSSTLDRSIAADDILNFCSLFFLEKIKLYNSYEYLPFSFFAEKIKHDNLCESSALADDSHEMSCFILSAKIIVRIFQNAV